MSVAELFTKDCLTALEENKKYILGKLSDPKSLISHKASGFLVGASEKGMGGLGDYAKSYLQNNADVLVLSAARAQGKNLAKYGNLSVVFNMLSQVISTYNDIIFLMLKDVARDTIKSLKLKAKANSELRDNLIKLRDTLIHMSLGDPVFEKYLAQLRAALIELESGRRDIRAVRNTLAASNRFQSKLFRTGKDKVFSARSKIQPLKDNKYLAVKDSGLARNLQLPSTDEQIHNIMIVPALSRTIIANTKNYLLYTQSANAGIASFYAGLAKLQQSMPGLVKDYIVGLFDLLLNNISQVVGSMSVALNGRDGAITGDGTYEASPLRTSVLAYQWAMDMNLVAECLKTIPAGVVIVPLTQGGTIMPNLALRGDVLRAPKEGLFNAVLEGHEVTLSGAAVGTYRVRAVLNSYELRLSRVVNKAATGIPGVSFTVVSDALGSLANTQAIVQKYEAVCRALKAMGDAKVGSTSLLAKEAQEDFVAFERQLLGFLIDVNASFASKPVRKDSLSLCNSFIKRTDLSVARDKDIIAELTSFINTPIPLEEDMTAALTGIKRMLKALKLDRAADALSTGDFTSFFAMDGRNATYVGAAMVALGELRKCFKDDKQAAQINKVQRQLERRQDLLTLSVTLDFDTAILKNLQKCVDLTGLANLFSSKESACSLLKKYGVGESFKTLEGLLSF